MGAKWNIPPDIGSGPVSTWGRPTGQVVSPGLLSTQTEALPSWNFTTSGAPPPRSSENSNLRLLILFCRYSASSGTGVLVMRDCSLFLLPLSEKTANCFLALNDVETSGVERWWHWVWTTGFSTGGVTWEMDIWLTGKGVSNQDWHFWPVRN